MNLKKREKKRMKDIFSEFIEVFYNFMWFVEMSYLNIKTEDNVLMYFIKYLYLS